MEDVPEFADPVAGPVTAGATLLTIAFLALRFDGALRLWALGIGLLVGCLVGHWFGIYDVDRVIEAPWIGLPDLSGWPGLDLGFGTMFWVLLPGFVMVTLVGAMDTLGDSIAIQRASWRTPRAIDFRAVQGAINADGVGNLLSGCVGTVPNTTYGSSIAIAEITGIAARTVGVWVGAIFVALAFLPKILAVIVAVPGPVAAAYLAVVIALLGMFGVKLLVAEGLDYRKSLIVGLGFWVGLSCQFGLFIPDYMTGFIGDLLGNGMTAGGVTVVLLSALLSLTRPRARRLRVPLDNHAIAAVDSFLTGLATKVHADEEMTQRLRAVGEETLHTLLLNGAPRSLLVVARTDGKAIELEFVANVGGQNLEDLAAVTDVADLPRESDASLKLLLHYASSMDHRQYHDLDVVAVRVE